MAARTAGMLVVRAATNLTKTPENGRSFHHQTAVLRLQPERRKPEEYVMSQQPVHEIRLGRVKAAIWANAAETGVRHNVTFVRLYKDQDQWKDSTSFSRDDLPLVLKVADLAHTWIYNQGQEGSAAPRA